MSSIGNSGARSSGPTGWSVPGCSGGGGGAGRSGITLYHWRGISDSSRVILVRSVIAASDLQGNIFPNPTVLAGGATPPSPPLCQPGGRPPQTPPAAGGIPSPQVPPGPPPGGRTPRLPAGATLMPPGPPQ